MASVRVRQRESALGLAEEDDVWRAAIGLVIGAGPFHSQSG